MPDERMPEASANLGLNAGHQCEVGSATGLGLRGV